MRSRKTLGSILITTALALTACGDAAGPGDDGIPWDRIPGRLAFVHSPGDGSGSFPIGILDGYAREVVDVTDPGGLSLSWSPDGGRLAFHRFIATEAGLYRYRIYTVEAEGGAVPEPFLPPSADDVQRSDPSWGPDGRIAFLHLGFDRRQVWLDEEALFTDLDAEANSRLAWSPDGAYLVVAMRTVGVSLYRITVATGEAEPLLLSGGEDELLLEPRYSPDGQRVFFLRAVVGSPPVPWVMGADGSAPGPVGAEPVGVWSPDGSEVAYVEDGRIRLVRADGSDPITLPIKDVVQVEWAP